MRTGLNRVLGESSKTLLLSVAEKIKLQPKGFVEGRFLIDPELLVSRRGLRESIPRGQVRGQAQQEELGQGKN